MTRRLWSRPAIWLAVGVPAAAVVTAMWVITAERIAYERSEAIEFAVKHNDNLALAFEENIIRTIGEIDRVVHFLSRNYADRGELLNSADIAEEGSFDLSVVRTAGVIDKHGDVVF